MVDCAAWSASSQNAGSNPPRQRAGTLGPVKRGHNLCLVFSHSVVQAGTTDVDAVRQAMYGQRIKSPSGFEVVMNTNHHLSKPVMIGKINSSGTFDVIWQSINPVRADAWSKYIPDSAKRTADWTFPWVCGGCIEPTFKEW